MREFLCKALNVLNGEQWSVQSREFAIIAVAMATVILYWLNVMIGNSLVCNTKVTELYTSFNF